MRLSLLGLGLVSMAMKYARHKEGKMSNTISGKMVEVSVRDGQGSYGDACLNDVLNAILRHLDIGIAWTSGVETQECHQSLKKKA